MKKNLFLITFAVFMPLFAAAQYGRQPVSLITHIGGGWGGFPGRTGEVRTDHFLGAIGADLKYGFSDNWSLLVGLDYQFRFANASYTTYSGLYNGSNKVFLNGHYLRLPIRVEYDYNWFYVAAGPYIEKGFGKMPGTNEIGLIGGNMELGGRLELNRKDHLRIGLLTSFGTSFRYRYTHLDEEGNAIDNERIVRIGYKELNWLLRVGYEHRF